MALFLETLEQAEMWYGEDGFPYRIKDMHQSHRINVVNFLLRRADNLYARHQWAEWKSLQGAPDAVRDAYEADMLRTLNDKPEEWLERTPLMQAMRKAIADYDTIDGEVVSVSRHEVVPVKPDIRTMAKHPAGPNRFA